MPQRTAIVTGAGSGIGRATTERLAADGHRVLALDLDGEQAERTAETVRGSGGTALAAGCDVRDPEAFAAALATAAGEWGPGVDVLANVAGIGVAANLADTDPADWDRVLGVNLTAIYHTCRAVLPGMVDAGGGTIVNVASVSGLVGVRDRAAYCASKAGVIGLTRSIAADYARHGVRANAICPGTVASEWIGKILADAPDPVAAREAMEQRQLDGRMGSPDEVANGIAFLASPEARFVNGSALVMDGGMTAV